MSSALDNINKMKNQTLKSFPSRKKKKNQISDRDFRVPTWSWLKIGSGRDTYQKKRSAVKRKIMSVFIYSGIYD